MTRCLAPKVLISDVDGVLTPGSFFYDATGKTHKQFGPDDKDALDLLQPFIEIRFITADKRGFSISSQRIVADMGYTLDLVPSHGRLEWIAQRYKLEDVIYIGDGLLDFLVMDRVGYAIAPSSASSIAKQSSNYITPRGGGDRAVSEACVHILEKFFVTSFRSFVVNGHTSI